MPDVEKPKVAEGYEGAIVLPPKCSMYMDNPVACVDYSSLYPSSMISQNYSHDSKVWSKEYDLNGNIIEEKRKVNVMKKATLYMIIYQNTGILKLNSILMSIDAKRLLLERRKPK